MTACTSNSKRSSKDTTPNGKTDGKVISIHNLELKPADILVCGSLESKGPGGQVQGIQVELRKTNEDDIKLLLIEGKVDFAKFSYEGPSQEKGIYILRSRDEDEVKLELQLVREENEISLEGVTVGTAYDATPFTLECVNDAKEAFPKDLD